MFFLSSAKSEKGREEQVLLKGVDAIGRGRRW
jgi:hypothetical protein